MSLAKKYLKVILKLEAENRELRRIISPFALFKDKKFNLTPEHGRFIG